MDNKWIKLTDKPTETISSGIYYDNTNKIYIGGGSSDIDLNISALRNCECFDIIKNKYGIYYQILIMNIVYIQYYGWTI